MYSSSENTEHEEDFSLRHVTSARAITWKIRNFRYLCPAADFSLDSPPFVFENATWCLRLYPNVTETDVDSEQETPDASEDSDAERDQDGFIGFTLVRLRSRVPHHRLQFNLIWEEDNDYSEHFFSVDFDESHKENGRKAFIDRWTALKEEYKLSETGILAVICQVSCCGSPGLDASSQTEAVIQNTDAIETLSQNYKKLLLNGEDHDVVVKVKDKEFCVHKIILRARSPVLESMLSHDMKEKNSGVVDIPDCDPDAFEQFLIYLYCAKIETLDADNMLSLYYIADKYDMGCLKVVCSDFIRKSLSTNNVSDVIELAANHSDGGLLHFATDYFVEHVKLILPTVSWQSFIQRNGIQANELFIKAINK